MKHTVRLDTNILSHSL